MLRLFLCCRLLTKKQGSEEIRVFRSALVEKIHELIDKETLLDLIRTPETDRHSTGRKHMNICSSSPSRFHKTLRRFMSRRQSDVFSLWGLFCPTRQETRRSLFRSLKNVSKCERSVRATSPTNKTRQKLHPQNINECPPEIRDRFFLTGNFNLLNQHVFFFGAVRYLRLKKHPYHPPILAGLDWFLDVGVGQSGQVPPNGQNVKILRGNFQGFRRWS